MGIFIFFGAIAVFFGLISLSINIGLKQSEKAEKKEREEQQKAYELMLQQVENKTWEFPVEAFTELCEEHKIYKITTEPDYQRAKLLAENVLQAERVPPKYYSRYTNQKALKTYIAGLTKQKATEDAEKLRQRKQQLLEDEEAFEEQCTYFAEYTDREKSIRYCENKVEECTRIIWECDSDEQAVRRGAEATYLLGKRHESSWAIHGGIASGIAGGAAGVAAALDTERRNQEKRQQNAALAQSIAALNVMQLEKIWNRQRSAEQDLNYWTAELKASQVLLSQKLNQQKLLDMLHPDVKNVEITETGAVKLKIGLHSTPNLIIYDSIKAVVDGSIKVLLKVGDEVVGSAVCVLPYGGMTSYATVNGICCKPKNQSKEYTFDFAPNHLWAVETKKDVSDSWGYEQGKQAREEERRRQAELSAPIKQAILNGMTPDQLYTLSELQESIPELAESTIYQVSGLMRSMIGTSVDRLEIDGQAKFRLRK